MSNRVKNNLSMRWVPVADATGRTHLEAVWVSLGEPVGTPMDSGPVAAAPAPEQNVTHAA